MSKWLTSEANKADPRLREAVGEIIRRISAHLPALPNPIRMYLAGGMAVHFLQRLPLDGGCRRIVLTSAVAAEG